METGVIDRICAALLRFISRLVPRRDREVWLQEWDAELRARRQRLAARNQWHRRQQLELLRRTLGAFFDAAWLRRQFTRDAEVVHDCRHGMRVLLRKPGFAMTAIGVLALGIGATVGIFAVVDALLLRALPYGDAERIVLLWEGRTDDPEALGEVAPANCIDWQEQLSSFESIGCVEPWSFDYAGGREPVVLYAAAVTNGFFRAFGTDVILGRTFLPEDHLPGRNRVIVVTHEWWQQALGGDPNAIGRTVLLDDTAHTVVGVLPSSFRPRLLQTAAARSIYVPNVIAEADRRDRGSQYWNAVARLKPGVTLEQARRDLEALSSRLASEYPRTNASVVARAQPLREHLAGNLRPALRLLAAAVGLLLLIAGANVANLLLARAAERTRELAVRSAVGAGQWRLVRQLLAESLLLASLGSMAGLAVAWVTVRVVVAMSPATIPSLASVAIGGRAIAFAMALTALVAVLVGVIPAWNSSGARVLTALRGATSSGNSGRHPLRSGIVIAEIALALLLLTGATLLLRSFATLLQIDPGFRPDGVVAVQVFAWDRQTTPEKRTAFFEQILTRMQDDPMIGEAGAVSAMPFIEANINIETAILPSGRAADETLSGFLTCATPGYFSTMRIAVLEGRTFNERDTAASNQVVVVSESLARSAWPGASAVGQPMAVRVQGRMHQVEVVGVVADVRHDGLDRPPRAEVFVPHAQLPYGSMTFVARVAGDAATAIERMKGHIYATDRAQAIYAAASAEELVSRSLVERRFMLTLLGAFALLAVVLAAVGIYGVISVATTQRTREFGVRVALGAERGAILRMVLRQGAAIAGVGLALGLAGSLIVNRAMARFLYEVTPTDPITFVAASGALGVVALVACLLPARRATRVDPLVALRTD